MGFLIAKQGSGLRPAPCFACGRLRRLAAVRCASLGSLKALQTPGSELRAVRREGQGLGRLGGGLWTRDLAPVPSQSYRSARKAVGSIRKHSQSCRKLAETFAKVPEGIGNLCKATGSRRKALE